VPITTSSRCPPNLQLQLRGSSRDVDGIVIVMAGGESEEEEGIDSGTEGWI